MATSKVSIGLPSARLIAHASGELVFSNARDSAFVDANEWPPRVVLHRGQHVRYAARSSSGVWLVYALVEVDDRAFWRLRWFDNIGSPLRGREEMEPVPERDRAPLYAELDEARRDHELAQTHRLEGVDFCGPIAVVVPRHVGLGDQRHPHTCRNGVWTEDTSLPPLDKPLAEVTSTHPTRSTTIVDGPHVLVWNGRLFVPFAREFVEYCSTIVSLGRDHSTPVPAAGGGLFALQETRLAGGLFALQETRLVEVHIDGPREHLPGVRVTGFQGGPDGTVVVETAGGRLLYDPRKTEVAELDALVGTAELAGVTKTGELLLFELETGELWRIPRDELATLPRRAVEVAPEPAAPPVVVLDAVGAASRPTIAAAGDIIVGCTDDAVRFWNLDLVVAKASLAPVAVAMRGERAMVLDTRGLLHELDPATGAVLGARPVTDQPRSLVGAPDRSVVIAKDAVVVIGAHGTERIDIAGAIAAAIDPEGVIVIVAEGRRLAQWERGQLLDIPETAEQIVAIAALGGRRFACAGQRNLFLLDLAHPELEALYEQNATPFIAASPNGEVLAWATTSSVTIAKLTGTTLVELDSAHYPETYTDPEDEPLRVCGLAFLDDERVAVALSGGRGNVLDAFHKKTKKLDPHPGDQRSRFLFTFAGAVLVAEDP